MGTKIIISFNILNYSPNSFKFSTISKAFASVEIFTKMFESKRSNKCRFSFLSSFKTPPPYFKALQVFKNSLWTIDKFAEVFCLSRRKWSDWVTSSLLCFTWSHITSKAQCPILVLCKKFSRLSGTSKLPAKCCSDIRAKRPASVFELFSKLNFRHLF